MNFHFTSNSLVIEAPDGVIEHTNPHKAAKVLFAAYPNGGFDTGPAPSNTTFMGLVVCIYWSHYFRAEERRLQAMLKR